MLSAHRLAGQLPGLVLRFSLLLYEEQCGWCLSVRRLLPLIFSPLGPLPLSASELGHNRPEDDPDKRTLGLQGFKVLFPRLIS